MLIRKTYSRFYRSLNYDYLLRDRADPETRPAWEKIEDGRWFPHLSVRLEPSVTTIVGANESGKTQVIDAVRSALSGAGVRQSDFCRYSELFAVDAPVAFPEFGIEVGNLTQQERRIANNLLELEGESRLPSNSSLWIFRCGSTQAPGAGVVYWRSTAPDADLLTRSFESLDDWTAFLPLPWTIDPTIALPDSVPIQWLIDGRVQSATSRQDRLELLNAVLGNPAWFASEDSVQQHKAAIAARLSKPSREKPDVLAQFEVARQLLVDVAQVDVSTFEALRDAVEGTDEGHATAVTTAMNDLIRKNLNPARWWTQDPEFNLTVGLRDHDLVFTIRDRTGKDYTFGERSTGLKYFLSYLVQFLAGRPRRGDRQKVLLMDEPDTYLSSRGQQDLLRVLSTAAFPDDPAFDPAQVVYVTHSPFLIDRNHAERVRVLDKGDLDEGTRVVDRAHHNRYEPLRSALGPLVGETTFMGSQNIIVEGPSDQIFVAAMATDLGKHGVGGRPVPPSHRLDLNDVTIVPAGGTLHVPYMAFLARGRGEERPPVVVLLDSDKDGKKAREELRELKTDGKPIVADDLVVEIDEVAPAATTFQQIEDLVPPSVASRAVDRYYEQLGQPAPGLDVSSIQDRSADMITTLNGLLANASLPLSLQKVAFARCVVETLESASADLREEMREAFAPLVACLAIRSAVAIDRERSGAIRKRMTRSIRLFASDRNELSQREHASKLLDALEGLIDVGPNYEPVRAFVSDLRSRYRLQADLGEAFADHAQFLDDVRKLPNVLRSASVETVEVRGSSRDQQLRGEDAPPAKDTSLDNSDQGPQVERAET